MIMYRQHMPHRKLTTAPRNDMCDGGLNPRIVWYTFALNTAKISADESKIRLCRSTRNTTRSSYRLIASRLYDPSSSPGRIMHITDK